MDNNGYKSLIKNLIKQGVLSDRRLLEAFSRVDRKFFLSEKNSAFAYENIPFEIGEGQTISQPYTVAFMLDLLSVEEGEKVLDVGSGSGWTTAILNELTGANGEVYGLERIQGLKELGEANISKFYQDKTKNIKLFCGDGWKGLSRFAPYDKILVSASAENVPEDLLKQLKIGGIIVSPIGSQDEVQKIIKIEKLGEDEYKETNFPGFVFVPLVHE